MNRPVSFFLIDIEFFHKRPIRLRWPVAAAPVYELFDSIADLMTLVSFLTRRAAYATYSAQLARAFFLSLFTSGPSELMTLDLKEDSHVIHIGCRTI